MEYFTERQGLRQPIEHTSIIIPVVYNLLLECCERYYDNIAWKFLDYYGNKIDERKLGSFLKYEIPTLYVYTSKNVRHISRILETKRKPIDYDQYALLDFIEFIARNLKDVSIQTQKQGRQENRLIFSESCKIFNDFSNDINNLFNKAGLLLTLTNNKTIERIIEYNILTADIVSIIDAVIEPGTKELLNEAITLFKQPHPTAKKNAVEKLWDAFERLKTYYTTLNKKASASKIVEDMSNGQLEFAELFDVEFKALTKIGNDFRIRHHETDKIDITDDRHHDYFFNRCMSLIALAIQYLK